MKSSFSDMTRKTASTLAASTCSSVACSATLRENFVRRATTAWIVAASSSGLGAIATQSPTAGSSPAPAASCESRAGGVGAELAELGVDDVGAAMLRGDARRDPALGGVRLEFGCVAVSPAEILQCVQASLLERDGRGGRAKIGARARLRELPEV